ncbi:MAG: GNAT family N-acetyltransferase [Proteobacteria bacterium]|nr:GNAT family N-acetyltransferase [Pseudomonadota bacterium]
MALRETLGSGLTLLTFGGQEPELARYLPELARLRITVFRDFPYLYDGSLAYEQRYLQTYADCAESIVALVLDGDTAVGASTGLPLDAETPDFTQPFVNAGHDPARYFYCAESVLLPAHRGRGVYPHLFRAREDHARRLGRFDASTFCCVQRPPDHPRRPLGYRPLDVVWRRQGYAEQPMLRTTFAWKDLDDDEETPKPMVFWVKSLRTEVNA